MLISQRESRSASLASSRMSSARASSCLVIVTHAHCPPLSTLRMEPSRSITYPHQKAVAEIALVGVVIAITASRHESTESEDGQVDVRGVCKMAINMAATVRAGSPLAR